MTHRVGLIPFDFVFRNNDPCTNIAVDSSQRLVVTWIGDNSDLASIRSCLKGICPICIRFAATCCRRVVRLFQGLIPIFQFSVGRIVPLAKIASIHRRVRKQQNGYA